MFSVPLCAVADYPFRFVRASQSYHRSTIMRLAKSRRSAITDTK